jgi:hypothetical protein
VKSSDYRPGWDHVGVRKGVEAEVAAEESRWRQAESEEEAAI